MSIHIVNANKKTIYYITILFSVTTFKRTVQRSYVTQKILRNKCI